MGNKPKPSLSVPVRFDKLECDPHEGTFQKMKVYICSPGKNRNYSYISKEELEAAKASLAYVPVVGRVYEKIDKKSGEVCGYYFGGHDFEFDENYEWRPTTVPYGVMTADEPWWETVEENGKSVEYLCGYCYLWVGRWPVLKDAAWNDTFWYAESMEMHYKDYTIYKEDSNFVEFHGCRFDALCILGYDPVNKEYNTEPCFPSAGFVPVAEFSVNSEQFSQLMEEMKSQLFSSFEKYDISYQKGGKGLTTDKKEMTATAEVEEQVEKAEAEVKDADTALIEAQSDNIEIAAADEPASEAGEDTSEVLAEEADASEAEEQAEAEENNNGEEREFSLFSMTYREKECALDNAVSSLNVVKKSPDGNISEEMYCWVMDFDDSFVYYKVNHYTANGSESKSFRSAYSVGEDNKISLTGSPEEVFQKWLTAEEVAKTDEEKAQLAELLKFKEETETNELNEKVNGLLSQFDDLANLEEYSAIKSDVEKDEKPDLASYELRLFALRGKQVQRKQEPVQKNSIRVGIDVSEKKDDGYDGLIERGRARRNHFDD